MKHRWASSGLTRNNSSEYLLHLVNRISLKHSCCNRAYQRWEKEPAALASGEEMQTRTWYYWTAPRCSIHHTCWDFILLSVRMSHRTSLYIKEVSRRIMAAASLHCLTSVLSLVIRMLQGFPVA